MAGLMRIGELATAAGVSNRTVDFYTNLGLIQPARRTESGYRLYDPQTVDLIATIRRLEANGMALDEIAGQLTPGSARDLADAVARLDQDLAALRTLAQTAGESAHTLVTTLTVRANTLITTALELIIAMPDV